MSDKYLDQVKAAHKMLSQAIGSELRLAEIIRMRPEIFEGLLGERLREQMRDKASLQEALSTLTALANETSGMDGCAQLRVHSSGAGAHSGSAVGPTATIDKTKDQRVVDDIMNQVAEFAAGAKTEMKLPNLNAFLAKAVRERIADVHSFLTVEKRNQGI